MESDPAVGMGREHWPVHGALRRGTPDQPSPPRGRFSSGYGFATVGPRIRRGATGIGLHAGGSLQTLPAGTRALDSNHRTGPAAATAAGAGTAAGGAPEHPWRRLLRGARRRGGGRMMIEQTLEKLRTLRLSGMVEAYRQQTENPDVAALSFEERLGLMV